MIGCIICGDCEDAAGFVCDWLCLECNRVYPLALNRGIDWRLAASGFSEWLWRDYPLIGYGSWRER